MNMRLTSQILGLALLIPATNAIGQSNTSSASLPSFNWNRFVKNVNFTGFYTHDYISNTGGLKAGPRNIGSTDLYLNPDLSKFSRVNGEVMVHYNHVNSNDARGAIGDAQVASNADMPAQTDRLTDLYYQHNFADNLRVLFGFHDTSTEFYINDSALKFLNSSFGIGADFTTSGPNGPTVWPLTTVGTRVSYDINDELNLKTAFYDADPGDETTYRKMSSGVGLAEGFLHVSELSHVIENQKISLGAWNYSKAQPKVSDETQSEASFGSWVVFEREVRKNLFSFVRAGWANPKVNPIQSNVAGGVVYRGIFQTKKNQDEIGFGFTNAHFSETTEDETAYETYYDFRISKQLSFRPDVQYITNPGGAGEFKNAWALGLRSVVEI